MTEIFSDWNVQVVLAYWLFFAWLAWRSRALSWLWLSVMLWAAVYVVGLWQMPQWFLHWRWNLMMPPYVYITVVSVVFLWDRRSGAPAAWRNFAVWFAVAAWLMTFAYGVLLGAVWYRFPDMFSAYMLPALWRFYWVSPAAWWAAQMVLALVLFVHQRINGEVRARCSLPRFQAGFLYALLVQSVCVFSLIRDIFT